MTNEEAIKKLKEFKILHTEQAGWDTSTLQALDMAIKALEQEPIAEERYQDLVEYFGDKDIAKCVLEDREEFKKWLERIKWHVRKTDELARKLEQEPRWISVSERLPEDNENVLMTIRRMGGRHNDYPFVSVGYIGWNQQSWWCAHDGDCAENHVEVIAWMPLPQSYTESEENK